MILQISSNFPTQADHIHWSIPVEIEIILNCECKDDKCNLSQSVSDDSVLKIYIYNLILCKMYCKDWDEGIWSGCHTIKHNTMQYNTMHFRRGAYTFYIYCMYTSQIVYNVPAHSNTIHNHVWIGWVWWLFRDASPLRCSMYGFFLFKSISMKLHPAYFSSSFSSQIWRLHHLRPHTGISSHVRIQWAHQLSVIQGLCAGVCVCAHMCARHSGVDIDVLSASGRAVEWSSNSNRKQCCLFPHRPEYNIMLHFFPPVKQRPECYSELQRLLERVQRIETLKNIEPAFNG